MPGLNAAPGRLALDPNGDAPEAFILQQRVGVLPSVHAVYIENQQAASRSILQVLKSLDPNYEEVLVPFAGYQSQGCPTDGLPSAFSNFTVFTFVRRPLDSFLSAFAETMGRVVSAPRETNWGGRTPDYYALPCNVSDRDLTAFVGDVVAKRPLGWSTFHIFPQVVKVGVHLGFGRSGFDFIGMVEHLEEHLGLLLERLHVANAAATTHELLRHMNNATTNKDRCQQQIRPTPHEVVSLKGDLCDLLSSDYSCLSALYSGTCAEHAEEIARRLVSSRLRPSSLPPPFRPPVPTPVADAWPVASQTTNII